MPNLVVNAGPGTGKTYTATNIPRFLKVVRPEVWLKNKKHTQEQLAIWQWVKNNILPTVVDLKGEPKMPSILYAAYNADMVPEVEPLVPPLKTPFGTEVRTIHGAGYKVLHRKYGYLRMNSNRGIHIVEKITGKNFYQMQDRFKWLSTLRFIEKCKDELLPVTPENCEILKGKYDSLSNMAIHSDIVPQAKQIVKAMGNIDRVLGIEYIDQIWLALYSLPSPVYDIGIIDECQDLSPARLLLVQKLCKNLIFVGDPDQGINAFAGADPMAFDKIRDICNEELPLKESFRNPPNIIDKANALMANRVIPDTHKRTILRGTKKEKGEEKNITMNTIGMYIKPENYGECMIICRTNAPLVGCLLKLLKAQVPAAIVGKSIITTLWNTVKQRNASSIGELSQKLDAYEELSCRSVPEHIQETIKDRIDCIRLVLPLCDEVYEIEALLKKLFKPKPNQSAVSLMTIHKAKGKERDNVFILYPPIESQYAKTPIQKQQEQNLHFVAITRTKKNLYWIYPT